MIKMKLPDFKTEQWMNDYENDAVYNMTDTCVEPLTLEEVLHMDTDHSLEHLKLDYGTITGDQKLKQQILRLYETGTEENLTLYHGCLEANEEVMLSLLHKGDRVITFSPGYQQFSEIPHALGCTVSTVELSEEHNWQPDMDQLKNELSRPFRMIILNNPNNPTGTYFGRECMKTMIQAAGKQDAWILSDEVYRGIGNDEPSVSDLYEKGISTSSLSKVFSAAGLRLGWVKADREVIHLLDVSRDYTIISTGPLADRLGSVLLQHQEELLQRSQRIVQQNRNITARWLREEKRCSIVLPEHGTVGFLKYEGGNSEQFARGILKKYGVFFVPGSCFGCENHLRLGFTGDPQKTAEGLRLVSEYLNEQ